jgi:hypothetical protein
VIEWKDRGREIVEEQRVREREEGNGREMEREVRFVREPLQPSC